VSYLKYRSILAGAAAAALLAAPSAIAQTEAQPTSAAPEDAAPQPSAPQEEPPLSPTPQDAASSARARQQPELPARSPWDDEKDSDTPPPRPEPRVRFGSKGQWVMMGESNGLGISSERFSNSSARFFSAGGGIGIDTFVIRNFSIGFDLEAVYANDQGYGASTLTETTSTEIGGGVRFGFNIPFGDSFSWYPRLTLGISSARSDTKVVSVSSLIDAPAVPPSSASSIGPWEDLYAPLLFQSVPHFVVGFGPRLRHTFAVTRGGPYDGSQSTVVGADFVVGGWWGGPAPEGPEQAERQVNHSFGERGQLVLTLATVGSLSRVTYTHSRGGRTNVNLAPSLDYFLVDNVSVGVNAFVGYSRGTSLDSTGETTVFKSTSIGVAPRLGGNIQLTERLSFWPQIGVGYGTVDTSEIASSGANQHSSVRLWVQVSAPLLVHPTSHFFLGAGPSLFHELSDADQFDYENDGTAIGASFVLGGWL
jgi:hypothetical protein